jgi:hypothetical protein
MTTGFLLMMSPSFAGGVLMAQQTLASMMQNININDLFMIFPFPVAE